MHSAPTSTRISLSANMGAGEICVPRLDSRNRNNNVSLPQADD